mmetsp:Transcript_32309/g.72554  ORF Transcript_32309/g.72554 Transcript_32309/m.72554 type:complete len:215 (-) Transcript_32309:673-1317(-)
MWTLDSSECVWSAAPSELKKISHCDSCESLCASKLPKRSGRFLPPFVLARLLVPPLPLHEEVVPQRLPHRHPPPGVQREAPVQQVGELRQLDPLPGVCPPRRPQQDLSDATVRLGREDVRKPHDGPASDAVYVLPSELVGPARLSHLEVGREAHPLVAKRVTLHHPVAQGSHAVHESHQHVVVRLAGEQHRSREELGERDRRAPEVDVPVVLEP